MKKLLMVLSGGQDSTTAMFLGKTIFDEIHTISFNYGQSHDLELLAANRVGIIAEVSSHDVIDIRDVLKSQSPLISDNELRQYYNYDRMAEEVGDSVENTFVPLRNTLFAIIAANRAIDLRCSHIGLGVCGNDSANYPDCTDSFLSALKVCINKSLSNKLVETLDIYAPLVNITKAEAIKMAHNIPECWRAIAYTHTSYNGEYPPLHRNHANILREQAFADAGLPDPLILRAVLNGLMEMPEGDNYADCK